jgi:hypothetical protein
MSRARTVTSLAGVIVVTVIVDKYLRRADSGLEQPF